eukprot:CAMPEP_0168528990 /NCGR_PEP_ID=MMETSP0405-20121227/13613_1 /TAXON_ID=498012 /ORGANISM="Trichosphaerium sp, Strain Am-I-7 wt" /LENGTH=850 /DNA_ID=CAMNT_0008552571 /DNA_START=23 /DNA_END=2572 /DNA_ORIENTATION=-
MEQAIRAVEGCLQHANNPNPAYAQKAMEQLDSMQNENYPMFLGALTSIFANGNKPPAARFVAALTLKNTLTSKNPARKDEIKRRWFSVNENDRNQVKGAVLNLFRNPDPTVSKAAPQCVAAIALLELPERQWVGLIDQVLLPYMTDQTAPLPIKVATLKTLQYITEEINPAVLVDSANSILTAVIQGIRNNNNDVKMAGMQALYGALEFSKGNFEKDGERKFIMDLIVECCGHPLEDIRCKAYELLVKIASLYYQFLPMHMHQIFERSLQSMQKDEESVGLQAIEFWSTLCDEELLILDEVEDCLLLQITPPRKCHYFVSGALEFIIPVLAECLTRQDEEPDLENWNVAMAAGTCLGLIAAVVEDKIVEQVMPFVKTHFESQNWKYREASLLAFGSILEGPNKAIKNLVAEAVPHLLTRHLQDQHPYVKDTASWAIGRITSLHPDAIPNVREMLQKVGLSLQDTPRVAGNCCWAISNLASNCKRGEGNPVTEYFSHLVEALLNVTARTDGANTTLIPSAYEALNVLVQTAPDKLLPDVEKLLGIILAKIDASVRQQQQRPNEDRERRGVYHGLLCSVLHTITTRLQHNVRKHADSIMHSILGVVAPGQSSLQEEALMAMGAIAGVVGQDFTKYMQRVEPILSAGLKNYEFPQVCSCAIGTVGDIARALEKNIIPYSDNFVKLLLGDLQAPMLNRTVKPPILSCFGDIAMAVGGGFERYLQVVVNMLQQASTTATAQKLDETEDYDLVDYINQLREGILDAYTGILQGLREANKAQQLLPVVEHILNLIGFTYSDRTTSPEVVRALVGLLGDLAMAIGSPAKQLLQQKFVLDILVECTRNPEPSISQIADW